jgi:hypothetical protein
MTKQRSTIVATAALVIVGTGVAFTDNGQRRFREFLNGLQEAPTIVSTTGTGTFTAAINRDESRIDYVLAFRNLEGDVRQAHIHIGHPQNSGGIVLWLCDSALNPSPVATTPECTMNDPLDLRNGRVTGTLTADDVLNQPGNGIAGAPATVPGEFDEVIDLIRAGATYVNVHTSVFPPGEIRSQINEHHGHGDRD